jgi:hypothetical protein
MNSREITPSRFFDNHPGGNGNGANGRSPDQDQSPDEGTLIVKDFISYAEDPPDHDESLLGENWLFRGGWGAVIGPTGQGKTSLMLQAAACWAIGRSFLGILPEKPLRILVVQIENGSLDLHEMAAGIIKELSLPAEDTERLREALHIVTPSSPSPELFSTSGAVARKIREFKPDLVIVDSLYKWLKKGTAADPEGVVELIDRNLLPLCRQVNCGVLVSHHMGRAEVERAYSGKGNRMTDTYAGAGGMFVADSARATLLLLPEEQIGQYTLKAAKRGSRIGWRDEEGTKIFEKHIAWSDKGNIGWRELDARSVQKEREDRKREKMQAQDERFREQVLWALEQTAPDGCWVDRTTVIAKCSGSSGPLSGGLKNTKALSVIAQMVGDGLLEQSTRKNDNNRNAAFIRKP